MSSILQPDDDGLVILDRAEDPIKTKKKKKNESSPVNEEDCDDELAFEIYESGEEDEEQNDQIQQHLDSHGADKLLENHDTQINTATSSESNSGAANRENINTNNHNHELNSVSRNMSNLKVSGHDASSSSSTSSTVSMDKDNDDDDNEEDKKGKKDSGSKTMEQWLQRDNLTVFPVWIGNLPRGTTVGQLRQFVEDKVGRVLVSIHINTKQSSNDRTYAFLNLPTAEKQLLAVTLLDQKVFIEEKLIVRPKRLVKSFCPLIGSSPISEPFKHFRDHVVPSIMANPTITLNVTSVRRILEENHIAIESLPNRVWCVQCTLVPQCHRTYCSFYHCSQEKELGRIVSILAAQRIPPESVNDAVGISTQQHRDNIIAANNPNTLRSKHTLLIQGLPRSVSDQKIEETFIVYGDIDNVIVNPDNTSYVRMKRSQDARKIVHLFKHNHAGVRVDFSPYGAAKKWINTDNHSGGDHSNSDEGATMGGNTAIVNAVNNVNGNGSTRNVNGIVIVNGHQNQMPFQNDPRQKMNGNTNRQQQQQQSHSNGVNGHIGSRMNGGNASAQLSLRSAMSEQIPSSRGQYGQSVNNPPQRPRLTNAQTTNTHQYHEQNDRSFGNPHSQWPGHSNQQFLNDQKMNHGQAMNNGGINSNGHSQSQFQRRRPPLSNARRHLKMDRTRSEPLPHKPRSNQYPYQQPYPGQAVFGDNQYPPQQPQQQQSQSQNWYRQQPPPPQQQQQSTQLQSLRQQPHPQSQQVSQHQPLHRQHQPPHPQHPQHQQHQPQRQSQPQQQGGYYRPPQNGYYQPPSNSVHPQYATNPNGGGGRFPNGYNNNNHNAMTQSNAFSHNGMNGINNALSPVAQTPINFNIPSPVMPVHGLIHSQSNGSTGHRQGIPNGVGNGVNGLPPSRPGLRNTRSEILQSSNTHPVVVPPPQGRIPALDDLMSPRNGYNPQFMTDAIAGWATRQHPNGMTGMNINGITGLSRSGSNINVHVQSQPQSVVPAVPQMLQAGQSYPQQTVTAQIPSVPLALQQPSQFSFPNMALISPRTDGSIAGAPAVSGAFNAPPPLHFQLSADILSPKTALQK